MTVIRNQGAPYGTCDCCDKPLTVREAVASGLQNVHQLMRDLDDDAVASGELEQDVFWELVFHLEEALGRAAALLELQEDDED
jgi:hypothetical protein